jgi:predicted amidohydrolase YtcJ
VGPAESIDDVVRLLREHIESREIAPGEWVVGYGYDDSLLSEKRHPDRDDLGRVSREHPVLILHVSLHLASANSMALQESGIDATTADPEGGVIRRRAGSSEPSGVLEEAAAARLIFSKLPASAKEFEDRLREATRVYASYGITTAQDGATMPPQLAAYRAAAARSPLALDVVAFPVAALLDTEMHSSIKAGNYLNGFRVGGVKFILDGSIQGKTAYLREPYLNAPAGLPADYRAYPGMSQERFEALALPILRRGVPALIHANGDAASDMMIQAVERAFSDRALPDHRTVMIHAQMLQEDQLDRVKELGIVPSYYAMHPFFWGDWHRNDVIGPERAARISPIRSTIDREIPFTIHTDAPVTPPDVLRLVSIAVSRKTRSGFVLGPEQRATVLEALHAVTLGSAYSYFEEDRKGSLSVGKQADLVVLSANPLEVEPDTIADLAVVETVARGQTVFELDNRR